MLGNAIDSIFKLKAIKIKTVLTIFNVYSVLFLMLSLKNVLSNVNVLRHRCHFGTCKSLGSSPVKTASTFILPPKGWHVQPIDARAARNRLWLTLVFLPLLTSSLLTKIGTIYTQLLQEEKIFPMMPRSGWSAEWSLRHAQKCSKSWVKNSEQNFLPLHLAAPC